jgi:hypothetical protein
MQMRPLLIVNPDELVEALLLLQKVERRGLGCLFLECDVHAFMTTVLLGATGLDALDLDPESEPPDGKPGEPELAAQQCHLLALEQAGNESEAFVHWITRSQRHLGSPQMPVV